MNFLFSQKVFLLTAVLAKFFCLFRFWVKKFSIENNRKGLNGLKGSIAKDVVPRLQQVKDGYGKYPFGLTSKDWNEILDKMIFAFEYYSEKNTANRNAKDAIKARQGMKLFAKFYSDLEE